VRVPCSVGSAANRLYRASFGTTGTIAVEKTVGARATGWQFGWICAAIASLAGFEDAVATHRLLANAGRSGAAPTGLHFAGRRAAVTALGVPVVALLPELDFAIAAYGRAGFAGHAAFPAGFNRLAIARAAIAALGVPIVAGLVGGKNAISARSEVLTGLSRGRTEPVCFSLTQGAATVVNRIRSDLLGRLHAVVTLFAGIQRAISAEGCIDRYGRSICAVVYDDYDSAVANLALRTVAARSTLAGGTGRRPNDRGRLTARKGEASPKKQRHKSSRCRGKRSSCRGITLGPEKGLMHEDNMDSLAHAHEVLRRVLK
jgi:hypothetical protein